MFLIINMQCNLKQKQINTSTIVIEPYVLIKFPLLLVSGLQKIANTIFNWSPMI